MYYATYNFFFLIILLFCILFSREVHTFLQMFVTYWY